MQSPKESAVDNRRPSISKRQKELRRDEKRKEKDARRAERDRERQQHGPRPPDEDPDIAGIVPGPQPKPWEDDEPASNS
jgi:hypothetical protein